MTVSQRHIKPRRRSRCHACAHVSKSFKEILAPSSPPFSDTGRINKRWSDVMDRYPCPRGR